MTINKISDEEKLKGGLNKSKEEIGEESDEITNKTNEHNKTQGIAMSQQKELQNQEAARLKLLLNEGGNLNNSEDFEKDRAKEDIKNMFSESSLKEMKLKDKTDIENIQKTTEKYGKIMDKYGVDVVVGWIPGGDLVSGAFSMMFFIYQAGKLPEGKDLPWYNKLKILGLQLVDSFGKPIGKIASAGVLGFQGGIMGLALGPIGAVVGAAGGAAIGYIAGGTIFDYFFKANKRSAEIFDKHCKKILEEGKKQGLNEDEYKKLEKDQGFLASWFGGNKAKQTA